MEKLIWHTMMSLDGYIAGRDDDMEWVFGVDGGSGETAGEVLRSTGALLVGRRTNPPAEPPIVKGVTGRFLEVGIEEAVGIAREAAGGDDVVVLGANIARQCIEAGLLDEITIHVAPVLVGGGIRLFERPDADPVRLIPTACIAEGETTVLRYSVSR
jgi:dihydrofolate reductase